MRSTNLAAVMLAALATGCFNPPADPVEPGRDAGQPRDSGLDPVPARAVDVDFGNVAIGERVERRVTIRNDGANDMEVTEVRRGASFDDAFSAQFSPTTIPPGGTGEFSLFFKPNAAGARLADFVYLLRGGQAPELVAHLKGTGVELGCSVEPGDALEFGSAFTGEERVRTVRVLNGSDVDWPVNVGAVQGDVEAFAFGPGFVAGSHLVPARGSLSIPIVFKSEALGVFGATFALSAASPCSAPVVTLRGATIDQAITWTPAAISFGYINIGQRVQAKVTLRNASDRDVTISRLAVSNAPGEGELFRLETTERLFTIKGGEQREFSVSYAPPKAGGAIGNLTFETDVARPASGTLALSGFGGGPNVEAPATVEFGQVAAGAFVVRSITVANTGSDLPGTTDDNLFFATRDASGAWVPRLPEVESATGEFRLEALSPPTAGVPAGEKIAFRVRFSPATSGPKQGTLRLHTNDFDEPQRVVALRGEGVILPPCVFEVLPSQLEFGTVEAGRSLTLNLQVRNKGANECRIAQLDLVTGSSAAYSLPNGPIANATINAGATLAVPVRFAPTATGDALGGVRFYSSSTTTPETLVTLKGSSAQSCLSATPEAVDFGLIPTSCASRERTVTVVNVCTATVSLDTIELAPGASPELAITSKPALPVTVVSGGSIQVKVRYNPIDAGTDVGALVLKAGQIKRVVPLAGSSSATAIQRDEFVQDSRPRVDVLFVVDDSCSMSDKQQALAANFPSFIQTAMARQVDYHIAVTTTSIDTAHGGGATTTSPPDANGRFVPLAGTSPRILTPATPNFAQVFASNVGVGTNGNYNEMLLRPAYLALSAPNILADNAGFLRPDANLAVIIVSDAEDNDSVSTTFYRTFLTGLKAADRKVTVSGFIPTLPNPPSNCSYDAAGVSTSTRARDVITQTGGVIEEICNSNWAAGMSRIGDVAFGGPRMRFVLSGTPDVAGAQPFTVEIDGQPYPALSATGETRWSYDTIANAIDFAPAYMPAPGARIAVTYHVACLP